MGGNTFIIPVLSFKHIFISDARVALVTIENVNRASEINVICKTPYPCRFMTWVREAAGLDPKSDRIGQVD
jgi:hypothetical protein